jgi:endonuclease/exonuclease/phosphatase family metal-dependent hydrolase
MAFSKLLRLLGFSPRPATRWRPVGAKPSLEALEQRALLSYGAGVSVMTYNLDEGTDFTALLNAPSPQAIPAAVSEVFGEVVSSNIPARALALARQIAVAHPDLAGLQEASEWTVNGQVRYDMLASVLQDLNLLHQHYGVVIEAPAFAGQAPDLAGDIIGFQDRNVILARTDLPHHELSLSNAQEGLFAARIIFPLGGPGGPVIAIVRSWAAVDVTDHGQQFRFVSTHLESGDPAVNLAQANEMLAGPANTPLPVVLSGDFNSPANGTGNAFNLVIAAGFTDVWSSTHPDQPGFTASRQDLADPQPQETERIDFIFVRGGLSANRVRLVGNEPEDRTPSGLWPSDHNGVVATIHFAPTIHVVRSRHRHSIFDQDPCG